MNKNKTPLRDVLFFLFGVTQLQIHKKQKRGFLAQQYDEPKSRRAHFTIGEIMGAKHRKGKIFNFSFWCLWG